MKLWLIIIAGSLLIGALGWAAHRIGVSYTAEVERDQARDELKTERAQNKADMLTITERITTNEEERRQLAGALAAMDQRFAGLLANLPKPETLVHSQEVPGAPCPRVGVSDDFVGVFNSTSTASGAAAAKTD